MSLHWTIAALCVGLCVVACSTGDTGAAFYQEKISCPAPATEQFASWGKSGAEHVCIIMHGPFVAYEDGFVHIRGQYDMGKESGVWVWYDKDGHVAKRVDYSNKDSPRTP